MSIVYMLIPLGIALLACAAGALLWAVNSGQFEDLEDAGRVVLEPDEPCVQGPDQVPHPRRES